MCEYDIEFNSERNKTPGRKLASTTLICRLSYFPVVTENLFKNFNIWWSIIRFTITLSWFRESTNRLEWDKVRCVPPLVFEAYLMSSFILHTESNVLRYYRCFQIDKPYLNIDDKRLRFKVKLNNDNYRFLKLSLLFNKLWGILLLRESRTTISMTVFLQVALRYLHISSWDSKMIYWCVSICLLMSYHILPPNLYLRTSNASSQG